MSNVIKALVTFELETFSNPAINLAVFNAAAHYANHNTDKIPGSMRSIEIIDSFLLISANVIYCIKYTF